jgi:hypothetical protein
MTTFAPLDGRASRTAIATCIALFTAIASLLSAPHAAHAAHAAPRTTEWVGKLRPPATGTFQLRPTTRSTRVWVGRTLVYDSMHRRSPRVRAVHLRRGTTPRLRIVAPSTRRAPRLRWRRIPVRSTAFHSLASSNVVVAKRRFPKKPKATAPTSPTTTTTDPTTTDPTTTDPTTTDPTTTTTDPTTTPEPTAADMPADAALAPTAPPAGVGPRTLAACSGVQVAAGSSIQSAIDAHGTNTTFCVAPGTYRIAAPIVPKAGDVLQGAPGAKINGSKLLSGFTHTTSGWMVGGQTRESTAVGACEVAGDTTCARNEDVYVDDTRLRPVTSLAALVPGSFFFDRAADRITLADDPTGHVVEVADTFRAFNGVGPATVRGFTIEKFANPAQTGAFHVQGAWTITDNVVRFNHGAGICGASGALVAHNLVTRNGQLGMCGTGSIGATFEANEDSYNNTAGFQEDWEAGGAKFAQTQDLVVRDNYVHDNAGPGLWTDIDNIRSLIEDNYVANNHGAGIFHEISYAAEIRHNAVLGNGAGVSCPANGGWCSTGIRISESRDVLVHGNVVRGDHGSILGIQTNRGSGAYGAHELRDVTVRDNDVTPGAGRIGVMENIGDSTMFSSWGITFAGNRYRLSSCSAALFAWKDASYAFTGWQGFGMDTAGAMTCT